MYDSSGLSSLILGLVLICSGVAASHPHPSLVQYLSVYFPLLTYTDSDADVWNDQEFPRVLTGIMWSVLCRHFDSSFHFVACNGCTVAGFFLLGFPSRFFPKWFFICCFFFPGGCGLSPCRQLLTCLFTTFL